MTYMQEHSSGCLYTAYIGRPRAAGQNCPEGPDEQGAWHPMTKRESP